MKRTILFFILITLCLSVIGQQKRKWRGNYLISGTIENVEAGKVLLSYEDITRKGAENKVKEASIADEKFAFSDYLEEPALVKMTVNDKEYMFYIDPTSMTVHIDTNGGIEVKGSWTNDDKIQISLLNERIKGLADEKTNPAGNLPELSYASLVKNSFVVLKKMQEVVEPDHPLHSDVTTRQMINILMSMGDDLKNTPSGVKTSGKLFLLSVKMYAAPK